MLRKVLNEETTVVIYEFICKKCGSLFPSYLPNINHCEYCGDEGSLEYFGSGCYSALIPVTLDNFDMKGYSPPLKVERPVYVPPDLGRDYKRRHNLYALIQRTITHHFLLRKQKKRMNLYLICPDLSETCSRTRAN